MITVLKLPQSYNVVKKTLTSPWYRLLLTQLDLIHFPSLCQDSNYKFKKNRDDYMLGFEIFPYFLTYKPHSLRMDSINPLRTSNIFPFTSV